MAITITINGVKWVVSFVSETHTELVDENGEQVSYGITLMRECEIYIDEGLPKDHMRQIVTHELVHAIASSYRENIECESEERICDFIAAHFDELERLRIEILNVI